MAQTLKRLPYLFLLTLALGLPAAARAGSADGLRIALRTGDVDAVRKVLENGAPATGAGQIHGGDPHAVELMKLLLDHGMSIKKEEKDYNWVADAGNIGNSLACTAAAAGNNELLKFELAHGAAPDGVYGQRPLHCAVQGLTIFGYKSRMASKEVHHADIEGIGILLDAGANPALRDSNGKSFVQNAETDEDRAAVLKLLSGRKIDTGALQ
jgi:ankyrin repeat protein